jgi:hypothetical protein
MRAKIFRDRRGIPSMGRATHSNSPPPAIKGSPVSHTVSICRPEAVSLAKTVEYVKASRPISTKATPGPSTEAKPE